MGNRDVDSSNQRSAQHFFKCSHNSTFGDIKVDVIGNYDPSH